jgi:hypothetical protein
MMEGGSQGQFSFPPIVLRDKNTEDPEAQGSHGSRMLFAPATENHDDSSLLVLRFLSWDTDHTSFPNVFDATATRLSKTHCGEFTLSHSLSSRPPLKGLTSPIYLFL